MHLTAQAVAQRLLSLNFIRDTIASSQGDPDRESFLAELLEVGLYNGGMSGLDVFSDTDMTLPADAIGEFADEVAAELIRQHRLAS